MNKHFFSFFLILAGCGNAPDAETTATEANRQLYLLKHLFRDGQLY